MTNKLRLPNCASNIKCKAWYCLLISLTNHYHILHCQCQRNASTRSRHHSPSCHVAHGRPFGQRVRSHDTARQMQITGLRCGHRLGSLRSQTSDRISLDRLDLGPVPVLLDFYQGYIRDGEVLYVFGTCAYDISNDQWRSLLLAGR